MSKLRKHHVLGHGLARILDESEIARVGGGHGGGGGCTFPSFVSDILPDGTVRCDPAGTQIP